MNKFLSSGFWKINFTLIPLKLNLKIDIINNLKKRTNSCLETKICPRPARALTVAFIPVSLAAIDPYKTPFMAT